MTFRIQPPARPASARLAPVRAPAGALMGIALLVHPHPASARSPEAALCVAAIAQAERAMRIPDGFLAAMSRVESGRPEADGTIAPWPWTITANGIGHYYPTRAEAVAAVDSFRQQGILSLDVGCMQVNLQQHPDAFPSTDQAFDPVRNALYAGDFLLRMHDRTGSWPRAAAAYHSQTPGIGAPYQWKVLEAWAVPQDGRAPATPAAQRNGSGRAGLYAALPRADVPAAPAATGGGVPIKAFHPFQGFQHFTEPALHRPVTSGGMHGRTLASYRANPVPLAAPTRMAD